ncbi:TPA: type II toxin-antitoxin system HicA family toxin [Staphylococcus pseudintermedius]
MIKRLERNGGYCISVVGNYHHFKHLKHKGKVTVPCPKKDLYYGTECTILK